MEITTDFKNETKFGDSVNTDSNGVPYHIGNRHERRKMASIFKIRKKDNDRQVNIKDINRKINIQKELEEKLNRYKEENQNDVITSMNQIEDTEDYSNNSINQNNNGEITNA